MGNTMSNRALSLSRWIPCGAGKVTGHPVSHEAISYRCFLSDLAGFTGLHCTGPGRKKAF